MDRSAPDSKEQVPMVDTLSSENNSAKKTTSPFLPESVPDLDRQTVLRLDLVLVPLMVMLYFLAWLDRANIGNARVVRFPSKPHLTSILIFHTGWNAG